MPSVSNKMQVDGGVVLGLKDIQETLLSLPQRLGVNVIRRGLLAGAGVMRDEARRLVPQQPGKSPRGNTRTNSLKKAITAESRGVFKDGSGRPVQHRAVVTISKAKGKRGVSPRSYAHLVEFGTRPHSLGKGSMLDPFRRSAKVKNQHGATHPGTAPQPFMRPAFDGKKFEAVRVCADTVRREATSELAKLKTTPRKTG